VSVPSSREVAQCLRDAALGIHPLVPLARHADGCVELRIDDWRLTLQLDAEGLARCCHCRAPDGRQASLEDWPRYGTNPVDHLSIWERGRLEQLLGA
jgi:hypothetical protein